MLADRVADKFEKCLRPKRKERVKIVLTEQGHINAVCVVPLLIPLRISCIGVSCDLATLKPPSQCLNKEVLAGSSGSKSLLALAWNRMRVGHLLAEHCDVD